MSPRTEAKPAPDARLHTLARKLLRSGMLPDEDPITESIGPSSGAACALCYGAILEPHVECTLEFAASDPTGRAKTLHFHVFCRDLWQAERSHSYGASSRHDMPGPGKHAREEPLDALVRGTTTTI